MSNTETHVLTGNQITAFRLCVLIAGAKLEHETGMRRRGPSCLSILKRELDLTGSAEKVIAQAEALKQ